MTTRIKVPVPTLHSRDEMADTLKEIAELTAEHQQLEGEMNAAVIEARTPFTPRMIEITIEIGKKFSLVQDWCDTNKKEFGDAKSIKTPNGVVGWRTGNFQAKPLNRKWTVEKILAAMLNDEAAWKPYLRVKQEVDKEKLIADRAVLLEPALQAVGLKIVQEESFYVEPAVVTTETRVQEAA